MAYEGNTDYLIIEGSILNAEITDEDKAHLVERMPNNPSDSNWSVDQIKNGFDAILNHITLKLA